MKVFIIEWVNKVSDNYHDDGGLVVVAADLDRAKALAAEQPGCLPTDAEWDAATVIDASDEAQERAFVFPNAGCC